MNDDLDAIRRVLAADVESFRRLVERYQRPLLTLIRNLTPPDTDHEGVAQEVFLAAFRSLASFDPKRSAFSTWLFTIARNRCRNELARRRPVVGALLPDVVDLRSPERAASEGFFIEYPPTQRISDWSRDDQPAERCRRAVPGRDSISAADLGQVFSLPSDYPVAWLQV